MKKISNQVIIIFYLTLLFVWSCSKDEDSPFEVSVNKTSISVDEESSAFDLTVVSNGEWVVSTEATWLRSNIESGYGNQTITISVSDNATFESRSGTLKISKRNGRVDDVSVIVSITQSQKDAIQVTNDRIQASWKGGDYELSFQDNVQTSIIIPDDVSWLHVVQPSETRSLSSQSVLLRVDENTGEQRHCQIKLMGGKVNKEVSVAQDAFICLESIQLSPKEIQITNTDSYRIKAVCYPDNASNKDLEWNIEGNDVIAFDGDETDGQRNIVAKNNGSAKVTVRNPKSGITASANVDVKVKATRIRVTNPPYGVMAMGWDCSFWMGFEVEPSMAYTDDIRFTSTNGNVVELMGRQVISHTTDGNASIIIELPYSGISTQFDVSVQKVYAEAAGIHINQRYGYFDIELGGKLTSQNWEDMIEIVELYLVDDNGYAHYDNHDITNNNGAYITWKSTGLRLNYDAITHIAAKVHLTH